MDDVILKNFTDEALKNDNKVLNEMEIEKIEYTRLKYYFQKSKFYLFSADQNDEQVNKQFQDIRDQIQQNTENFEEPICPILFFYFIRDADNMEIYLALYSNAIGIIYDLILGLEYLNAIFESIFPNTCLVPQLEIDRKSLSYLVDLSGSYFLNSYYIKDAYEKRSLEKIIKKIEPLNRNCSVFFKIMIRLIVYYVPLIGISTDNLYFSPKNNEDGNLPELEMKDFDEIEFINSNTFQTSNLCLHKKSFEFYTIDVMKYEGSNKFSIQRDFYQKIYSRCESSFIVPCYGIFGNQQKSCYGAKNGFLFKFICNRKLTSQKKNGDFIVKLWDNTTKSLNMYRLLISITFLHEFGYFHRNVKPDHIFIDNENKAYFGGFATICKLDNTNNEQIGATAWESPEQYEKNISTPLTDIYSYGLNVYYFITGNSGDTLREFFVEDEKMKKLIKECTNYKPQSRPDSFVLFIQMHELNYFLKKTNKTLIDNLFNSTCESLLRTNFENGKYLSIWAKALEASEFKNVILNYLPLSFIYKFAFTELECILNHALNDNIFLINYEKDDIFQINFFAEQLNNEELKKKTDDIIELLPKPYQIISKLIFYANFLGINYLSDEEYYILNEKFEKEFDEFADNFDDCILLSSSFSIDPQFILNLIDKKDLNLQNSHNTILYILQIADSSTSTKTIIDILKHFKDFSDNDIHNLDLTFQTEDFSKEFKCESNNVPDLVIDINMLKEMELKLDKIMGEIDKEQDESLLKENNEIFQMIDKIEEEQKYINLLASSLEIK